MTPHCGRRIESQLHKVMIRFPGASLLLICTQTDSLSFLFVWFVPPYETSDIRLKALDTLPSSGYSMYVCMQRISQPQTKVTRMYVYSLHQLNVIADDKKYNK